MKLHPFKYLAVALLLAGCTRLKTVTEGAVVTVEPVRITDPVVYVRRKVIVLPGQSNMVRLYTYALEDFKTEYVRLHGPTEFEFITCAEGGTVSWHWIPGGGGYENCMAMARGKAVTDIIYMQGESDAYNSMIVWAQNFALMLAGFRSVFGDVPVTIIQIARAQGDWLRGWQAVQDLQAGVHLPNVCMVRSEDLVGDEDLEDEVHIKQDALGRIWRRVAGRIR